MNRFSCSFSPFIGICFLTHNYLDGYTHDFTRPFGGGLERYVYDLCGVISRKGWWPVVHQLAYFGGFQTVFEGAAVRGFTYDLNDISGAFERMTAAAEGLIIYGSCIWHPIPYLPGSIGICHGVSWDWHDMEAAVKADVAHTIQHAVNHLDRIVTVDSHFLTYCRANCSYDDAERLVLLPNAVDTSWFTPAGSKTDIGRNTSDQDLLAVKSDGDRSYGGMLSANTSANDPDLLLVETVTDSASWRKKPGGFTCSTRDG